MKKIIAALLILVFYVSNFATIVEAKSVTVKGYRKKNGHYVQSHSRKVNCGTPKRRK